MVVPSGQLKIGAKLILHHDHGRFQGQARGRMLPLKWWAPGLCPNAHRVSSPLVSHNQLCGLYKQQ